MFNFVSGRASGDCRYVADVTISRMSFFTSQPDSRNSTASQSSSSGCEGGFSLRSEILRSLHNPGAEQLLPKPVNRHAGRQRIGRIDQPLRQAQPIARVRTAAWAAGPTAHLDGLHPASDHIGRGTGRGQSALCQFVPVAPT